MFLKEVRSLGRSISRSWAKTGLDLHALSMIAAEELSNSQFHASFREDDLIKWIAETKNFPDQLDIKNRLGEPSVTLWSDERIALDACFWRTSSTLLHDHGFAGAVMHLQGQCVQNEYEFTLPRRHSKNVELGKLTLLRAHLVRPGFVQPIVPDDGFLHAVWHVDVPTITLNVRSRTGTISHLYYLPGTRIKAMDSDTPVSVQRKRDIVRYLFARNHPGKEGFIEKILCDAKPEEGLHLLQLMHPGPRFGESSDFFDHLVGRMAKLHGDWIAATLRARNIGRLTSGVASQRLRSREHRVLVCLLCTLNRLEDILRWVQAELNPSQACDSVAVWASELIENGAIRWSSSKVDARTIRTLMEDRLRSHSLGVCNCFAQFGGTIQELLNQELLSPLFHG